MNQRSATAEDETFLYEVYAGTRRNEVAEWGFGTREIELFLQMQHRARQASYSAAYPDAVCRVIYAADKPIGSLQVYYGSESIVLIDIALLPEARGKGVGSAVLLELQQKAAQLGLPVMLHVDNANVLARKLYGKLGFKETMADEIYTEMRWEPPAGRAT
ncbi:GNAT family N-acetyltransferase [Paenibacillus gorillae]|uniref:GNAT family N-acetyltransferase n=1 Tax=Paenibacillus gorillae TaxID=1243662 RepID=UPI0004B1160D|nr:GNAT family N-acetyltransferase [Paenibacillus gorillae]